jgi:hypothetical protein
MAPAVKMVKKKRRRSKANLRIMKNLNIVVHVRKLKAQ